MHVGFTGTRWGCNGKQRENLRLFLQEYQPEFVHHGDCIGADTDFHNLVRVYLPKTIIYCHPPIANSNEEQRWWARNYAHFTMNPESHFARNRAIVELSDLILAVPFEHFPQKRGGTWYTIDYARKLHVNTIIFCPDGTLNTTFFDKNP